MIPAEFKKRLNRFMLFAAVLTVAFSVFLYEWASFCLEVNLFSYALIIPAVSLWLIWQRGATLRWEGSPASSVLPAVVLGIAALLVLGTSWVIEDASERGTVRVALRALSFVMLLNAGAVGFLGVSFVRQILFPCVFLVFMVPFPPALVEGMEVALQHASAEVSGWFFSGIGLSHIRDGRVFQLPSITIEVARECSGIRSTIVLFITGLIAAYLFLEKNWQRVVFCALIIPLGIARNAFRIVTIGWLCTEYGPEMIDSPIHHRGGPVFFALSLVPLFILLWLFRRMNGRDGGSDAGSDGELPEMPKCPNKAT